MTPLLLIAMIVFAAWFVLGALLWRLSGQRTRLSQRLDALEAGENKKSGDQDV